MFCLSSLDLFCPSLTVDMSCQTWLVLLAVDMSCPSWWDYSFCSENAFHYKFLILQSVRERFPNITNVHKIRTYLSCTHVFLWFFQSTKFLKQGHPLWLAVDYYHHLGLSLQIYIIMFYYIFETLYDMDVYWSYPIIYRGKEKKLSYCMKWF